MEKTEEQLTYAYSPEESCHGFVLRKVEPIPELCLVLAEWEHLTCGTQLLHVANDDPDNLFCLSFRTYPENSNGAAHILEHIVLAGSQRFPLKDPFFSMLKRSLATFMNALTGDDFTCYPASSQVSVDFYNLLEVYLDAVFFPLLRKNSFEQEGHRLEFERLDDPTSRLQRKGVVFNEMKGALASSQHRLFDLMQAVLYPDTAYQYISGGDPKIIPTLTHEELIDFHSRFYHPSRALFYFYGNFPIEGHLRFLADHLLDNATLSDKSIPLLNKVQPFRKPKEFADRYPIALGESLEEKTIIGMGWVTCSIEEQLTLLAFAALDMMLMGNDASILKKAILESKLCKQVDSVLHQEMLQMPYMLVFKGCSDDAAGKLETVVRSVLEGIVEKGMEKEEIESAIHQLEIERLEINSGHYPFGLSLFFRAGLLKQHGGNPALALKTKLFLKELREMMLTTNYISDLIQRYFLSNVHFARIVLFPDPQLTVEEEKEERTLLEKMQKALSEKEKQECVLRAIALKEEQEREEKVDILPCLAIEEIARSAVDFSLVEEQSSGQEIHHHCCFTNHMVYADLVFPLQSHHLNEYAFLPLYASLLAEVECANRSYEEQLKEIQMHTGGIDAALATFSQTGDCQNCSAAICIAGMGLSRKKEKLLPLMYETAYETQFSNEKRIYNVLVQMQSELETSLTEDSMQYAIGLCLSFFSPKGYLNNVWSGLDYFRSLKNWVAQWDLYRDMIMEKLSRWQQEGWSSVELVLSCDEKDHAFLKEQHDSLAHREKQPFLFHPVDAHVEKNGRQRKQGIAIAAGVAYNCKAIAVPAYDHPSSPLLAVAAQLLMHTQLHPKVREKGGAYGSCAVHDPFGGAFYFYSYRDPHIASTYAVFDESVREVARGEFDGIALDQAKRQVIQKLDRPIDPGRRAMKAYWWKKEGREEERRAHFRCQLLDATKDEVMRAVEEYLCPYMEDGVMVTFAGQQLLQRANEELQKKGQQKLWVQSLTTSHIGLN